MQVMCMLNIMFVILPDLVINKDNRMYFAVTIESMFCEKFRSCKHSKHMKLWLHFPFFVFFVSCSLNGDNNLLFHWHLGEKDSDHNCSTTNYYIIFPTSSFSSSSTLSDFFIFLYFSLIGKEKNEITLEKPHSYWQGVLYSAIASVCLVWSSSWV